MNKRFATVLVSIFLTMSIAYVCFRPNTVTPLMIYYVWLALGSPGNDSTFIQWAYWILAVLLFMSIYMLFSRTVGMPLRKQVLYVCIPLVLLLDIFFVFKDYRFEICNLIYGDTVEAPPLVGKQRYNTDSLQIAEFVRKNVKRIDTAIVDTVIYSSNLDRCFAILLCKKSHGDRKYFSHYVQGRRTADQSFKIRTTNTGALVYDTSLQSVRTAAREYLFKQFTFLQSKCRESYWDLYP